MKAFLLIAWRDAKQILRSPMFFLIGALCGILWFINFRRSLGNFVMNSQMAQFNQAGADALNVHTTVFLEHVSITNLILLFTVPALTMRLISEEKKSRTFDLLLTSPVSAWQITCGKFLGGLAAVSGLLLISMLYPMSTALLTNISWGVLFSNYLGLLLISGVYVAAGLFASSLTESAVLSMFMAVIFNLLFWLIGQLTVGSSIEWLAALKDYISAGQQLYSFMQGNIRTTSIIFFLSAIGFFVFLSERVVESSRWR